jgi:hypothetical protein
MAQTSGRSKKSPNKTTNRNKAKQSARGNTRSSVGNAKGRSQRSVASAERRGVGKMTLAQRSRQNVAEEPRSRRIHGSKARRQTGTPKRTTKSRA